MRRLRILGVLALFIAWALLIAGRLIWVQVIRHHYYVEQAAHQQEHSFEVSPRRGILYDRNLHALTMTVLVDSIYAVPSEIGAARPQTAAALARIVHTDPTDRFTSEQQILARMNASRNFTWIARKQDASIINQVKALNLKGIYFQQEFKRFYPDNQVGSQVLGYVGLDDNGLGGLELEFDANLHGKPGRMRTAVDAKRHVLGSVEQEPVAGENLVLSIDENIQFMAEQALDRNMERTKAVNGTIVVQDPHTGQILALAVRPTFNPNDFRHATTTLLRNHAVSDVYEPGSTFKLVAYSAALEEHVTTPDAMIDTQGGKINVAGRIVHDDRDAILYESRYHNVISTSQALWESSDVAAIKLAERMGPDTYYKYIHAYGFGERSGIELPAETRGLLKPVRHWNPTTIGSIPIGQEIGVTPVQLITMASTIANGGMYLPPHILLESQTKDGKLQPVPFHPGTELPNPLPEGAHRVISTLTAAEMRRIMEGVVQQGTGIPAQLNGYSAAGKTGTAQKIDPLTHTYSKTKYIASFVGFAPVNDPAITVAIVMDSPQASMHYGTAASAPLFHDLAQQILEYLGVPHDQPLKTPIELAQKQAPPVAEDEPSAPPDDLGSLFAEVNNLPADDPLRNPTPGETPAPLSAQASAQVLKTDVASAGEAVAKAEPPPTGPAPEEANARSGPVAASVPEPLPGPPAAISAQSVAPAHPQPDSHGLVTVASGNRVAVPSFLGEPVRNVVEQAGGIGLQVKILGSGIARDQAPAPGAMVVAGTKVVVRFGR
jgi:cell division protein FtsI (penicillin-binding protein 3)